jgi:hypothetical protein
MAMGETKKVLKELEHAYFYHEMDMSKLKS